MRKIILCLVFLLLLVSCKLNSNSKYNITYNLDGGTLENPSYEYETGVGLELLVPTKEGYNFLGWFINGELVNGISKDYAEDVVISARWEKIKNLYNVEYNGYDNLNTSVYENETVVKPNDPTKSGYKFDGWYLNDELFDFNSVINENITLDAKFSLINYSISYDLVDGSFEGDVQTSYNVEEFSELDIPSKSGYIFLYYIDEKGNIVESLENKCENLHLTAVYEKIEKVITLEIGSYQVIKYYEKGAVLQNELFELIDGRVYDAKFDFKEFVVEDDVKISASEYIIYEIELQTEENVLYGDHINGHYIYKNVVENSNNVVVRPFISEKIIVDAIYNEIEFTDNLVTLLIKEGFEKRTYYGSSNPNLIILEYENGVTFIKYNLSERCPNLQVLILPETLNVIPAGFYTHCNNLEIIYFRGVSRLSVPSPILYKGGNLKIYFENDCPVKQNFVYIDDADGLRKELPIHTYIAYEELFK